MQPSDLTADNFVNYPSLGRALAIEHLDTLRKIPLALLPSLLREIIQYDFLFPVERSTIENQLSALAAMNRQQLSDCVHGFEQISLSHQLKDFDWINRPSQFLEQQSAWLWSTHQLDAFRAAADGYSTRLSTVVHDDVPSIPRLGIAIIGQGVTTWNRPVFRYLRAQGTSFSRVAPENGVRILLDAAGRRAQAHPAPYAHWYIDGGEAAHHDPALTSVSFDALAPVRSSLLKKMQKEIERPGMGPEQLRTWLAQLTPTELGIAGSEDPVFTRLKVSLFTEGSGTQIFSTTFAQWATREVLRRAQALTVVTRFAPRQLQRPMNELLSGDAAAPELDPAGSLVDADMGAWYHWVNQQRLPGYDKSAFIAWFEDHNQAVAIGPAIPRGVESNSTLDMTQLLAFTLG